MAPIETGRFFGRLRDSRGVLYVIDVAASTWVEAFDKIKEVMAASDSWDDCVLIGVTRSSSMTTKDKRSLFHRAHYNIIAAQIKHNLTKHFVPYIARHREEMGARNAILDLALDLARRFKQDNPNFDPVKFLEACSPDVINYNLADLWEDE